MYKTIKPEKGTLKGIECYEGERIEQKILRITVNKEPITDGAPLIYTERKDGVEPGYDIRTDRFEIAVDAMDKVTKSVRAKRENKSSLGEEAEKGMEAEKKDEKSIGGPESIQDTK